MSLIATSVLLFVAGLGLVASALDYYDRSNGQDHMLGVCCAYALTGLVCAFAAGAL